MEHVKTFTLRLPESIMDIVDAGAKAKGCSKNDYIKGLILADQDATAQKLDTILDKVTEIETIVKNG